MYHKKIDKINILNIYLINHRHIYPMNTIIIYTNGKNIYDICCTVITKSNLPWNNSITPHKLISTYY